MSSCIGPVSIMNNLPSSLPLINWTCGGTRLQLGQRTLIMGVLNVTPDSFSDGGSFLDPDRALEQALALRDQGADILDVGGESTRPGAPAVSAAEETDRIGPVLQALQKEDGLIISVDTTKASVAAQAVALGACIINDVSGLTQDPEMIPLAAKCGAGVVAMHMQGRPETMQTDPQYGHVVEEVGTYFAERMDALTAGGIDRDCIALDPGIGFGKTLDHNLELLAGLDRYKKYGRPLLVGLSRKSFLGTLTGKDAPHRLHSGLGAMGYVLTRGAHILRVHDVAAVREAVTVVDALREREAKLGTAGTDHSC